MAAAHNEAEEAADLKPGDCARDQATAGEAATGQAAGGSVTLFAGLRAEDYRPNPEQDSERRN